MKKGVIDTRRKLYRDDYNSKTYLLRNLHICAIRDFCE